MPPSVAWSIFFVPSAVLSVILGGSAAIVAALKFVAWFRVRRTAPRP